MCNGNHERAGLESDAEAVSSRPDGLSEEGSARRNFLGRIGKWGSALAVFGLAADPTMQALFSRSAFAAAQAAGIFSPVGTGGNLPPIPADQNPPPPPVPTGTIYWVATNGNDNNNGSEGSPFATVKRAYDQCGSGDGIYVRAGFFAQPSFTWTKPNIILRGAPGTTREQVVVERAGGGGGSGRLISFRGNTVNGSDPGVENVHLYGITLQAGPTPPGWVEEQAPKGSASDDWKVNNWRNECLELLGRVRNCSFINCDIRHYYYRGFFISSLSSQFSGTDYTHNSEIAYCNIHWAGFDTAGADVSVSSNTGFVHVHHCELHGQSDGVVIVGCKRGSLVEYNHIYNQTREDGVDMKHTNSDNPLLPSGHRTIIRNNIIHNCAQQAIAIQRGANRVDVYDNYIYDNGYGRIDRAPTFDNPAIWVNAAWTNISSGTGGETRDARIFNNTVYNTIGSGIQMSLAEASGYPRDIEIKDNILYNNRKHGLRVLVGQELAITGNIFSENNSTRNKTQYQNSRASRSDVVSDNNTAYLPDSTYLWGEDSSRTYTLGEWQSAFNQDKNSTTIHGRFEMRAPPAPPPNFTVTDAGCVRRAYT